MQTGAGAGAGTGPNGAPLFVFRAHCFQIDAKTKRSWLPLSEQAIQISVFFEASRQAFRFVSLDHPLAQNGNGSNSQSSLDGYVLSSTVLPATTFTRTSAKFLQWLDVRAQTVFGLGFANEADLNRFIERFKSIREAFQISTASAAQQGLPPPQSLTPTSAHSGSSPPVASNSNSNNQIQPATAAAGQSPGIAAYSQDNIGLLSEATFNGNGNGNGNSNGNVVELDGNAGIHEYVEQLRAENEKLRSALQSNATNYRKWQEELSSTRAANTKLQNELSDARTTNAQLNEQLAEARSEVARLRASASDQHERDAPRNANVDKLVEQMAKLKLDVETKQNEVEYLKQRITELLALETRFETLSRDAEELEAARDLAQRELMEERAKSDDRRRETSSRVQDALLVHTDLGRTLTALTQLYNQMTTRLKDVQHVQSTAHPQPLTSTSARSNNLEQSSPSGPSGNSSTS